MRRTQRQVFSVVAGLFTLAGLVGLTLHQRPALADAFPLLVFIPLIVFTTTFGVVLVSRHITIGRVSLLPLTTLATYLALGPLWAAWAAWMSAILYTQLQYELAEWMETPRAANRAEALSVGLANATIHTLSLWLANAVFRWAGGYLPWVALDAREVVAFLALGGVYLGASYLIAGGFIALRGREPLRLYWQSLADTALMETAQLIFAPLVALIYLRLRLFQFLLFAIALGILSVIMHTLARATQGLKRRVEELDSLQAVSAALSGSLDLTTTLETIWKQVSRLMPADNFYVALHDANTDEVSFPLAIENNQPAHWRSRQAGNGLTEYVLRTRAPLLLRRDIPAAAQTLGLDLIGRAAQCWLGVPLLAGDEALGVVAVQAFDAPEGYDESHQKVLAAIAGQAAVALQNARLYAQTDAALTHRVQELDSILRTIGEGVLLFDPDWRVLAANRALTDLMGVAQSEFIGQLLLPPKPAADSAYLPLLGFTLEALRADCQALTRPETEPRQHILALPGASGHYAERTLTPVRNREGLIAGWLLVLRDVTEERELARVREDMTQMLVHDLRSPLAVIMGSVDTLAQILGDGASSTHEELLDLARQSSARLLELVNTLLDISKLESGEMPLQLESVSAEELLAATVEALAPLADAAKITVTVNAAPDLPPLRVDQDLVGRALHNLLDNALKFTPDGGGVKLWARRDPTAPEAFLHIGVSDTGPGIPPEAQIKLFKKFQQTGLRHGRRRGTGLGLSFCKLVAEAHGGKIWVESEVGKGTVFVMSLPVEGKSVVSG